MEHERIYNLDVIKIVAAFAICFHHYKQCFQVSFGLSAVDMVLPMLGWAVELFFMISGFVAAKSLNRYSEGQDFKKQYIRKIARLYPSALLSVMVSAIIMLIHHVIFGNCVWNNQYSVVGIITSFFMVNQGWIYEFAPALNNPIWYICVLLWLYLFYYVLEYLVMLLPIRRRGGVQSVAV